MTAPEHVYDVVVVGGGFSGIGAAIKLTEQGFDDFVVLEDGDQVGGTWHWNRYPGVAVDIPSFSYQFSFEKRPTWSRSYAKGAELQEYADHCVDKYGVRDHIRLSTRVARAELDEDAMVWRVTTTTGEVVSGRFLINAAGILTQPKNPDIPGIGEFDGDVMHTARWDDTVELRGRRVGIIGTGASAVQIVPEIAAGVDELVVFQRTPIWCFPKPDFALGGALRWSLGSLPGAQALTRAVSQTFVEVTFPLSGHYYKPFKLAAAGESLGRAYLQRQVQDPVLRAQLTPSYAPGCKRPSFHNSYLATFNRDNVTLETQGIAGIEARGVRTAAGVLHELDVLILATGFKVFESGNLPSYPVVGRRGVELEPWWEENGYEAYEGVTIPGFPNYFTIFGPYGYVGSSYFALIETSLKHILRLLTEAGRAGAVSVEVKREASSRYLAQMRSRRHRQLFHNVSCTGSNSYYFTEAGEVPFRAGTTVEAALRASVPFDDYTFEAS